MRRCFWLGDPVVRIHYDAEQQLVFTGSGAVLEKPVMRAYEVDRDFAIGFIFDQVVLTFRRGTEQAVIEQVVNDYQDYTGAWNRLWFPELHHQVNYGNTMQIAAPGVDLHVLAPRRADDPGTDLVTATTTDCREMLEGDPNPCTGASFAAPLVSGAAALAVSLEPSLAGSPLLLKDRILRNACPGLPTTSSRRIEGDRFLNVDNILQDNLLCPFPLIPEAPQP